MATIGIDQSNTMRARTKGQLTRNMNWVSSLEEGENNIEIFVSIWRN